MNCFENKCPETSSVAYRQPMKRFNWEDLSTRFIWFCNRHVVGVVWDCGSAYVCFFNCFVVVYDFKVFIDAIFLYCLLMSSFFVSEELTKLKTWKMRCLKGLKFEMK